MTLNRAALATALNASLEAPEIAAAAMAAAYTCPEPVDYHVSPLLNCIKSACMSSIDMSSPMTSGSSYGGPQSFPYHGSVGSHASPSNPMVGVPAEAMSWISNFMEYAGSH